MAAVNWRTINIDIYDQESAPNFALSTVAPAVTPVLQAEFQSLSAGIKQLLRSGDSEGALRSALEQAPYGGDQATKDAHLATVVEVLQSIKQADMAPMLGRLFASPGGTELMDALMKYLYRGMSNISLTSGRGLPPPTAGFSQVHPRTSGESGGQSMSVLLSWHERLVETAGQGSIVRVMTDRRTV